MNRKNNPMLSLAALVLLAIILVLTCTGCAVETSVSTEPRFTDEYAGNDCWIITDTQTGVQYLYYDMYNAGGLCKLEG